MLKVAKPPGAMAIEPCSNARPNLPAPPSATGPLPPASGAGGALGAAGASGVAAVDALSPHAWEMIERSASAKARARLAEANERRSIWVRWLTIGDPAPARLSRRRARIRCSPCFNASFGVAGRDAECNVQTIASTLRFRRAFGGLSATRRPLGLRRYTACRTRYADTACGHGNDAVR